MHRYSATVFGLLVSTLPYNMAHADGGKSLYAKNCTGCHGTEVFTRNNRRVKDYHALTKQVRQCSYTLETKWFDNDIKLVSDYLNKNFYKF